MGERQEASHRIIVDEDAAGLRLDIFLAEKFSETSRSQIKKWFAERLVFLNNEVAKKAGVILRPLDQIVIQGATAAPTPSYLHPAPLPLTILYEDDAIVVINKPKNLVIHPGAGTGHQTTLVEGLLYHLGHRSDIALDGGGGERPGIVHRLDKDTTGAIVCAKNEQAHRHLAQQFHDKTNLREYVALLDGVLPQDEVVVESYLFRDPNNRLKYASMPVAEWQAKQAAGENVDSYRYAKSVFYKHRVFGQRLTLARVRLFTGRTHQIRIHAATLHCAVIGDALYHPQPLQLPQQFPATLTRKLKAASSQLLHARLLGFVHPITKEKLGFTADFPQEFQELLEILENNTNCQ